MKELPINTERSPLYAWKPEDGPDRLEVIEKDIRSLMLQVAEAQLSLSEQGRQHNDKTKQLLLALIDVLDAFGRVFRNVRAKEDQITPQMKIWMRNFSSVSRLLERVLQEQGVTRIEIVGQAFDPYWHKAVEAVSDPTKAEGTISEVVRDGYVWHNEIIRKSEVFVVRNSDGEAESDGE